MSSVSALNAGLEGIHKGLNGIKKNAYEIANAGSQNHSTSEPASATSNIAEPLVYMKLNKLQAQASAKVVQTSADMIGTLIDMKA